MDFVEIVRGKRRNSLAEEIRGELRTGTIMNVIGLIAVVIVAIAALYDALEPTMMYLLIPVMLISMGRTVQRERLLKKAADALESKAG